MLQEAASTRTIWVGDERGLGGRTVASNIFSFNQYLLLLVRLADHVAGSLSSGVDGGRAVGKRSIHSYKNHKPHILFDFYS